MFSYLHDRMHLSDLWMARNPLLRFWFPPARRQHDLHHHAVDDSGRMDTNFGIGFFRFDRIFRSIAKQDRPFNRAGFAAVRLRYGLIEKNGKRIPDNSSAARLAARLR